MEFYPCILSMCSFSAAPSLNRFEHSWHSFAECLRKCVNKLCFVLNGLLQMSHMNILPSACVNLCFFKSVFFANFWSHSSHECFPSFMWSFLMCCSRRVLRLNFILHSSQLKPFSPVWLNRCDRNCVDWMNFLSQCGQACGRSPVWTLTCRLSVSFAEKHFPHCKRKNNNIFTYPIEHALVRSTLPFCKCMVFHRYAIVCACAMRHLMEMIFHINRSQMASLRYVSEYECYEKERRMTKINSIKSIKCNSMLFQNRFSLQQRWPIETLFTVRTLIVTFSCRLANMNA